MTSATMADVLPVAVAQQFFNTMAYLFQKTEIKPRPRKYYNREFKKTTTATSCGMLENNGVNEKNKTALAKYNLVGFSAVLCKITP